MALLTNGFLIQHPIRSGLIWAALFVPVFVLLDQFFMGGSLDNLPIHLPILIIFAVPGGIAWGYAMRWWHKRRLGASG